MNIGENLRLLRQQKGLEQKELARKLMVSPSYLCQLERGSKPLSLALGQEIAEVFGCTLNDLIHGPIPPNGQKSGKTGTNFPTSGREVEK